MILVTGATGFVGAALVRQLLGAGQPVRILRRSASPLDLLGDAAARVEHATGDVADRDALDAALRGVTHVYHVAAAVAFGGRRDAERLHAVNVRGTAAVVNACLDAGVARLAHTSSIAALGRPEQPGAVIDEATPWTDSRANTAYAVSKRLAEREVQRGVAEGLDAVIVNPAVVFGPGRRGENTMALVERVAAGRVPAAPPGGTAVVDVEDVAAGLRAAMAHGATGERYILSAANLPWTEILGTLADALGAPRPRRVLSPRTLLALGWLGEAWARLPGTTPGLARETARSGTLTVRYSHAKAVEALGLSFRPFEETAARIASALRA
jgi:dihydroflavonol-4-reductase